MGFGDGNGEGEWQGNRRNALNGLGHRIAWWAEKGLRVWSEDGEVGGVWKERGVMIRGVAVGLGMDFG